MPWENICQRTRYFFFVSNVKFSFKPKREGSCYILKVLHMRFSNVESHKNPNRGVLWIWLIFLAYDCSRYFYWMRESIYSVCAEKFKTNNARSQHLGFKSNTTLFLDFLHVKERNIISFLYHLIIYNWNIKCQYISRMLYTQDCNTLL